MFHATLTLLTAATLLAHSVLGCCWHSHCRHDVTAPGLTHRHAANQAAEACRHAHDGLPLHSHARQEAPAHPGPVDPECEHSVCVFVSGRLMTLDLQSSTWDICGGQWAVLNESAVLRSSGSCLRAVRTARRPAIPAEARALLQVWLV